LSRVHFKLNKTEGSEKDLTKAGKVFDFIPSRECSSIFRVKIDPDQNSSPYPTNAIQNEVRLLVYVRALF
jgi:hypothetical protein